MKYFGALIGMAGFLLLLGTAGASDLNTIPFDQTVVQAVIGLAMLGVGVLVAKIAEEIAIIKERKEQEKHEHYHH